MLACDPRCVKGAIRPRQAALDLIRSLATDPNPGRSRTRSGPGRSASTVFLSPPRGEIGERRRSSARSSCSLPNRSCVVAADDLDRRCGFRHPLTVVRPPERMGLSLPRTGAGSAACSKIRRRCGWIASRFRSVSRVGELSGVALECRNPALPADFYSELTGVAGCLQRSRLVLGGPKREGKPPSFQRAPSHEPPTWPDPASSMQIHLHFRVDDLDAAERAVLNLGATKFDHQPAPGRSRVFADPAGHPFCLVPTPLPPE
jgi:Glyoxalase-like domain